MGLIVGFGSTEDEFEREEERAIADHIEERYTALGLDYYTDAFRDEIQGWLKARSNELHSLAAEYKTAATYPDRYSYYWPWVIADASHMVVILSIHHVNRRHGLSPDGWGCLVRKHVFDVPCLDFNLAVRAA